jgi:hypothetical protein
VDLIRMTTGGVEFSFVACLGPEEDATADDSHAVDRGDGSQ